MQRRRFQANRRLLGCGAGVLLVLLSVAALLVYTGARKKRDTTSRGLGFHFTYDRYCDELLNSGGWIREPLLNCKESARLVATCGPGHDDSWQWSSEAARCGAARLAPPDLRRILSHKWVAVVGDSIGRNFFAAILRLLADERKAQGVVLGHMDFEHILPGDIRASFHWAPYTRNATLLLDQWQQGTSRPDSIVLSVGLWHMLHITSASGFAADLQQLRQAALAAMKGTEASISLCSLTEVYPPKLRSEEKRQKMTYQNVDAYNLVLATSGIFVPHGPMYLLDIHHLTQGCGAQCTADGIHYSNATYDAALQIWGNNLRALPAAEG